MWQQSQRSETESWDHPPLGISGGLSLADPPPLWQQALQSCVEAAARLRRTLGQADNPATRAAARIASETGTSVDPNPYFARSLTDNVIEAVIRAAYHTRAMPEVLLALWAKEGSMRMALDAASVGPMGSEPEARAVRRSSIYYLDYGLDILTYYARPAAGGDNQLMLGTSADRQEQDRRFAAEVARLVQGRFLSENIADAVNRELTVARAGSDYTVRPSMLFHALSLQLMDAVFARYQGMPFGGVWMSDRLTYMLWNMGEATFRQFMASAEQHRQEPAYQVGGQPATVERWSFETRPRTNEWKQARENAIRFGYFIEAFAPIFRNAINLIKPGIEDLRNANSRVAALDAVGLGAISRSGHGMDGSASGALTLVGGGADRFRHDALERNPSTDQFGDNVELRWNFASRPTQPVRVVVFLHGYARSDHTTELNAGRMTLQQFLANKARHCGLGFSDADGTDRGKVPTLVIIPRGLRDGRTRRFGFGTLARPSQLDALITASMSRVSSQQLGGATLTRDNALFLAAHSGGGSGINTLLGNGLDPYAVLCFDSTYSGSGPIRNWMRARRRAEGSFALRVIIDQGSMAHLETRDGAQCCVRLTECSAREILSELGTETSDRRVEHTTVGHGSVDERFSKALALDPNADLGSYGTVVPLRTIRTGSPAPCGLAPCPPARTQSLDTESVAFDLSPTELTDFVASPLFIGLDGDDSPLNDASQFEPTYLSFLESKGLLRRVAGNAIEARLLGRLIVPTSPTGAVPIVFIVMGNHPPFDGSQEIRSLDGYDYLQQHLATLGVASCSVDTNVTGACDLMIRSRAEMLLSTMDLVRRRATGALAGRFDWNRVGLVGHSRGGEAVVMAALLARRRSLPFQIGSVCSIAPTDFSPMLAGRHVDGVRLPLALQGGRYLVLYGSHDGDVAGAQSEPDRQTGTGFRLYDRARTSKTMVFARGLTHNRFNTIWRECADYADGRHAFVRAGNCRLREPGTTFDQRIFAAQVHREYAKFFVGALMRRTLLSDAAAEGALRGIDIPTGAQLGQPAGLQGPAAAIQWHVDGASVLEEFDPTANATTVGGSIEVANQGRPRVPHITQAYVAGTAGNKVRISVPSSARDQRGKNELTFRLTSLIDVTNEEAIRRASLADWEVRITSPRGTSAAGPAQLDRRGLRAPNKPFFHTTSDYGNATKHVYDTLSIPLTAFNNVDWSAVQTIELEAKGGSLPLLVDSIAFV